MKNIYLCCRLDNCQHGEYTWTAQDANRKIPFSRTKDLQEEDQNTFEGAVPFLPWNVGPGSVSRELAYWLCCLRSPGREGFWLGIARFFTSVFNNLFGGLWKGKTFDLMIHAKGRRPKSWGKNQHDKCHIFSILFLPQETTITCVKFTISGDNFQLCAWVVIFTSRGWQWDITVVLKSLAIIPLGIFLQHSEATSFTP